ncbi:hypothetical protein LCGC14_2623940 [marine sediment metagenome]|uniref:Uncharacterized protein n=1 Tax=marine sediment metagenome TaxID=412755 RepID=A0A0F9CD94_9ZZZZ
MANEAKDKLTRAVYPKTIADDRKVVAAAGTAEAIEDAENVVDFITITAETNNTGVIAVGASTVVAALTTEIITFWGIGFISNLHVRML